MTTASLAELIGLHDTKMRELAGHLHLRQQMCLQLTAVTLVEAA